MVFFKKAYKRIVALIALLSLEFVLVLGIFLGSLILFGFMWNRVINVKDEYLDQRVFTFLKAYTTPENTMFWESITFLGSGTFLVVFGSLIAGYYLFIKKHHWYSLKVPVVAAGSLTLNLLLKYIFSRPRPLLPLAEATGFSFPSGHAMVAFSFYGLLIYLSWMEIKNKLFRYGICVSLFVLILLIGFSRIYLRVHYTTDVIAGFAMGVFWLIISLFVLKKLEKYSKKEFDLIVKRD